MCKINFTEFIYYLEFTKGYGTIDFEKQVVTKVQGSERRNRMIYKKIISDKHKDKVVIFTNEVFTHFSYEFFKSLKDNHIKLVLVLIDPYISNYGSMPKCRSVIQNLSFDYILTFDPEDARRFNYLYCPIYSKILNNENREEGEFNFDLCYFAHLKNRIGFIRSIIRDSKLNHCSLRMGLSGVGKEYANEIPREFILDEDLKYEDVIEDTIKSNCILDITQEGQCGATFRYYEAIIYNKKLLTNNKSIQCLKFYDPRHIRFFDSVNDIDWEWIKRREPIHYEYNNEFSPLRIIDIVQSF